MKSRRCEVPGCREPARRRFCVGHAEARRVARERAREQRRVRATPTERGYGTAHKRLRARWARVVAQGNVLCARCHKVIQPGTPWDLGHVDLDKGRYAGPEHRKCNRSTAEVVRRRSRVW